MVLCTWCGTSLRKACEWRKLRKNITKFCYQGRYYHLEYSVTLYNTHICRPHGNVWKDSLEIQGSNLFRMSPKYSCTGALASLLARREAKSVFTLQAYTPARHFFFNKIKGRSFHSTRPPTPATPGTRVLSLSFPRLREWAEPLPCLRPYRKTECRQFLFNSSYLLRLWGS